MIFTILDCLAKVVYGRADESCKQKKAASYHISWLALILECGL